MNVHKVMSLLFEALRAVKNTNKFELTNTLEKLVVLLEEGDNRKITILDIVNVLYSAARAMS